MLPALLAQIGLPLLLKLVGGGLAKIDSPVAKVAASAIADVSTAIDAKQITPEQIAEGNRHIETLAKVDSEEVRDVLKTVNETIRTEVNSQDEYVRRWRPYWGYVSANVWAAQVIVVCAAIVSACGLLFFGKETEAQILFAGVANLMEAMTTMWAVALTVLGVSHYVRSREKTAAAGGAQPSIIAALASRLTGGTPPKGKS